MRFWRRSGAFKAANDPVRFASWREGAEVPPIRLIFLFVRIDHLTMPKTLVWPSTRDGHDPSPKETSCRPRALMAQYVSGRSGVTCRVAELNWAEIDRISA